MNAIISGRAGLALLVDGAHLQSLHYDEPDVLVPRRAEDYHLLLGDSGDLEFLEDVRHDEVRRRLDITVEREEALDLLLITLDPDLPDQIRRQAAHEVQPLIEKSEIAEQVEQILYAQPLPASADPAGALRIAAEGGPGVSEFVQRLIVRQPKIVAVRRAWEMIPDSVFGSIAAREYASAACVRAGVFRKFTLALHVWEALENVITEVFMTYQLQQISNLSDILFHWAEPLGWSSPREEAAPSWEFAAPEISPPPLESCPPAALENRESMPPVSSDAIRPRRSWYLALKSAGDFVAAALMAVACAPILIVMIVLVRLTSKGPALYAQPRVGKNGVPFNMYKIRTMRSDVEAATGPVWSSSHDPRVTSLGRILRKLHMDELPQLWNVLRGEMSIVGPRPERPEFSRVLADQIPHYRERLNLRPGITGLAQVSLPPDTDIGSVRRKTVFDLYYVRNVGPWLDLLILLSTAWEHLSRSRGIFRGVLSTPKLEAWEQRLNLELSLGAEPRLAGGVSIPADGTTHAELEPPPADVWYTRGAR
jgi:lipopolysaccharide/colanic/teichoic acid biosynthesis glycosyltransferase